MSEFIRVDISKPEDYVRLEKRIADLERQLSTARADAASWESQADDRAADAVRFAEQARTARADGRADGLREAAKVCDQWPHHVSAQCADAIRALIPPQEET